MTLVLAIIAAVAYRDHTIRVEEAAKWRVEIAKCQDGLKTAVDANKTLQVSADKLILQIKAQNERIKALAVQQARARQARDEALASAYQGTVAEGGDRQADRDCVWSPGTVEGDRL